MKLTDIASASTQGGQQLSRTESARAQKNTEARDRAPVSSDRVDVSGVAKELAAAIRASDEQALEAADPARIEELRQAIADGTLEIDAEATAESIVASEIGGGESADE